MTTYIIAYKWFFSIGAPRTYSIHLFTFFCLSSIGKCFPDSHIPYVFFQFSQRDPKAYPNEICNPSSDFLVYPQASSQPGVSGNPRKEGAQEALLSDFWTTSAGCPWHDGAVPLLPVPSGLMSSSEYLQGCTQQPYGETHFGILSLPRAHDHRWWLDGDPLVNQKLCLLAQLPFPHKSPVQCLITADAVQSISCSISPQSWTQSQDTSSPLCRVATQHQSRGRNLKFSSREP